MTNLLFSRQCGLISVRARCCATRMLLLIVPTVLLQHCGAAVLAQVQISVVEKEQKSQPLTLHPASEPVPALKYQLLPPMIERIDGNAIVYYGKIKAEQTYFFSSREIWEHVEKVPEMTLEAIAADTILRQATRDSSIYKFIRLGARCTSADWQILFREEPYPEILLPDVQQMRQFVRLLRARARMQLADKDYEGAIDTLQSGLAMSRHLCESPTVVSGLIGAATAETMLDVVEELIQQPGAPNLYWALASLPVPFIDMRTGIEAEQYAIFFTEPRWLNIESIEGDKAFWNGELRRLWKLIGLFQNRQLTEAELNYLVVCGYTMSKRRLIDSGMDEVHVAGLPVSQVVMIDTIRQYKRLRDDLMKWAFLPFHQSQSFVQDAEQHLIGAFDEGQEVLPLAATATMFLKSAKEAAARTTRTIAWLQLVEAVRLHAVHHEGKLPRSLDEIQVVPVPTDPATGSVFAYRVEGNIATIESPEIGHLGLVRQIRFAE